MARLTVVEGSDQHALGGEHSARRLRLALDLADIFAYEINFRTGVLTSNPPDPALNNMAVRSFADLLVVFPEDVRDVAALKWESHLSKGQAFDVEYPVTDDTGRREWLHDTIEAVKDTQGDVIGLIGVKQNITTRKWTEATILAEREAARAADLAKSEFLANMSHEIRTPLNGVIAIADVLSRCPMAPDQVEMVGLIRTSGETLSRLLSDILDIARIESGRLTIEERPFHLGEALRDVIGLVGLRAQEKGLEIDTDITAAVERTVCGDEVRLKQVVTNLLSNAVKFTERGGVKLMATLTADPDIVLIQVEDTGIGFDDAMRARLFRRFEQADGSITRRFGGSGLGLSISRELARAMQGDIDCSSTPGRGSRFSVRLRLPEVQAETKAESGSTANDEIDRRLRILVADDHVTNQRVAQLVLAQADADVTIVDNGEKALQAFKAKTFDLVLMDMQMPVLDGLSATRAIRTYEAESGMTRSPIIVLTANAAASHVVASLEAGADMHLAKPFTAAGLLRAVASLVGAQAEEAARTKAKRRPGTRQLSPTGKTPGAWPGSAHAEIGVRSTRRHPAGS